MQNYKKLGFEAFFKNDFKQARIYFNLAYEKRKNKNLLKFIELCSLGEKKPKEAQMLADFYLANQKVKTIDKDFEYILNAILCQESEKKGEFEDGYALNYNDFLESERKLGFKDSFERIIFSSKLVIDNKDDFLEFLEKLFENGYKEIVLNYYEAVLPEFATNSRFIKLGERLGLK